MRHVEYLLEMDRQAAAAREQARNRRHGWRMTGAAVLGGLVVSVTTAVVTSLLRADPAPAVVTVPSAVCAPAEPLPRR